MDAPNVRSPPCQTTHQAVMSSLHGRHQPPRCGQPRVAHMPLARPLGREALPPSCAVVAKRPRNAANQPKSWGGPWCMSIWPGTFSLSKCPNLLAPGHGQTRTVQSPKNVGLHLSLAQRWPLDPSPTVATKVVLQANAAWPRQPCQGLRFACLAEPRPKMRPPRPKPNCNGPVLPPDSRCATCRN